MTTTIRKDDKQWLIYQEEEVSAIVDAIRSYLIGLGAFALMGHDDEMMRTIGHFGERMSSSQMDFLRGEYDGTATKLQRHAMSHIDEITGWLADEEERPDVALDDIKAALVWLDKRAIAAGLTGDGWYREIVKTSREPS